MNILLRIVAVFVLLGSLAYGSYAVGRYVLSEKLFGRSVAVQPSSGLVATVKPRVTSRNQVSTGDGTVPIEVQVLPADQAETGPDVASIKDLQTVTVARRSSSATAEKPKIVNANTLEKSRSRIRLRDASGSTIFGANGVQGDDDRRVSRRSRRNRDRDEERPRRRRRRRNRSSTTTVVADSSSTQSSSRSDSRPARRSSSDDSNASRPSRRSSSSSNDAPARSQGGSSDDSGNGPF